MKLKTLLSIFSVALLIECLANFYQVLPIQYISKPSLMVVLLVYFQQNSKNLSPLRKWIIAALIFSWLGDVILLAEKQYRFLFVFGLLSFLVAHIFYIIYFWQIKKHNLSEFKTKPSVLLSVLIYSGVFYFVLFPHLSMLKIPVLAYISIISLMLIASFHAFDLKKQVFGQICVVGTLLFVISDSAIAINRFIYPFEFSGVFIILTYAVGQLLIIEGALRNLREIKLK